ncbi:MAG: response regulator [Ignavibacteria bacterium]|nr:MAG: response regulator [Ignavibacteria bacterium]
MINVLLLDDDKNLVNTLSRILKLNDCNVEQALTVSEAITKIESGNFNLLIADYYLTDGTAISILEKIKESGIEINSIIISGMSDHEIKQACIDAGADLFIEKPFKLQYFVECITNLLEGRVE